MITARLSQGAKYLQLLRRTGLGGVWMARIHRQSSSICLLIAVSRKGKKDQRIRFVSWGKF